MQISGKQNYGGKPIRGVGSIHMNRFASNASYNLCWLNSWQASNRASASSQNHRSALESSIVPPGCSGKHILVAKANISDGWTPCRTPHHA